MAPKKSKRLVIDANIFLSAGGEGTSNPRAVSCRDFLQAIYDECHKVVTTPDLRFEWKKEPTKKTKGRRLQDFARKWLTRMKGKKKVLHFDVPRNIDLRDNIVRITDNDNDREEMLADIHLIEAALAADLIVISLDNNAHGLFQTASARIGKIRRIVWVNPEMEDETPLEWLRQGAPKEVQRTLGHGID